MTKILGVRRAEELMRRLLEEQALTLSTPDDLYAFGAVLSEMGGIESAVGALLSTRAVMLGASGRSTPTP
jgi:hypothetical protein